MVFQYFLGVLQGRIILVLNSLNPIIVKMTSDFPKVIFFDTLHTVYVADTEKNVSICVGRSGIWSD